MWSSSMCLWSGCTHRLTESILRGMGAIADGGEGAGGGGRCDGQTGGECDFRVQSDMELGVGRPTYGEGEEGRGMERICGRG